MSDVGPDRESSSSSRLQLAGGNPEHCGNPLCHNLIEPPSGSTWRRTARKYCSDECRQAGWVLARAAKLLFQLEPAEWFAILKVCSRKEWSCRRLKNTLTIP